MQRSRNSYLDEWEIASVADEVTSQLAPDVIFVGYRIGQDSVGDPAIFFRVVMSDEACLPNRILDAAKRLEEALEGRLQPYQRWGLYPYFRYRSASEQAEDGDPAWQRNVFA